MSTQRANADMFDTHMLREPLLRVDVVGRPAMGEISRLNASRGIIFAVLMAVPFWAIVGAALYYWW